MDIYPRTFALLWVIADVFDLVCFGLWFGLGIPDSFPKFHMINNTMFIWAILVFLNLIMSSYYTSVLGFVSLFFCVMRMFIHLAIVLYDGIFVGLGLGILLPISETLYRSREFKMQLLICLVLGIQYFLSIPRLICGICIFVHEKNANNKEMSK